MPRRNHNPRQVRPQQPGLSSALLALAEELNRRNRSRHAGIRHAPTCNEPDLNLYRGRRGDQMAYCRNCEARGPIPNAQEAS